MPFIMKCPRLLPLFVIVCLSGAFWPAKAQVSTATITSDRILEFDFPDLLIGVAEYPSGPTGTTVFYFPDGVMAAGDVRGGSTGTVNSDAVSKGYEQKMIQAVVYSGGSWYGLSAATGVANEIKEIQAEKGNPNFIAGVLGGIIYDVGGRRYSRVTPDDSLGRVAVRNAVAGKFPLGAKGAGRFAMQGSYLADRSADRFAHWAHSGQGGAFAEFGPTKVAVFTVVNALGSVVDRNGRMVRWHRNDPKAENPLIKDVLHTFTAAQSTNLGENPGPTENTTLTLVVTNQKLPYWALQRMATQIHTSMGRGIQPFHTQHDGDMLYAVTTSEVDNPDLSPIDLATLASELAWDAILASVPELPALPDVSGQEIDPHTLEAYVGTYRLGQASSLQIYVEAGTLKLVCKGFSGVYFQEDKVESLLPVSNDLFFIDGPGRDLIRFERKEGKVTGFTINPGKWPIPGKKED